MHVQHKVAEPLSLLSGARPRPSPTPSPVAVLRPRCRRSDGCSDLELLRRAVCDERAFEVFFARFRPLMYSCALKVAGRSHCASAADSVDDVVGEIAYQLVAGDYRRLKAYDAARGCSVASWVGLIATSVARDYFRSARRHVATPTADEALAEIPSAAPSVDDCIDQQQQWEKVRAQLPALSRNDRRFMELYFIEGLAPEHLAREMRISVGTVYSKKAKITKRLGVLCAHPEAVAGATQNC